MSLQKILDAAQAHGSESDPDHEVGDLQDALSAAWELLAPPQRAALLVELADQLHWGN